MKKILAVLMFVGGLSQAQSSTSKVVLQRKRGPGIASIENLDQRSQKRFRQFETKRAGCVLKSIETCSCDAGYRDHKWQQQIAWTEMKFSNCADVLQWNVMQCRTNCTTHVIEGIPTSFTPLKYDFGQYSFPAGFVLETDKGIQYQFGDTSRCSISQPKVKIQGRIVGFEIERGGNVDYWGLLLEGSPPNPVVEYTRVVGPGAGDLKIAQKAKTNRFRSYHSANNNCRLTKIKICLCPANYRKKEWEEMINYTMMRFQNCKRQVWGSIRCRDKTKAKCTTKEIHGKPKYFYGYKYTYYQYSFPTGFRIVDEDKREYNFGNTHRGAINQGRNRIDGSIVGFNVQVGGNIDYWGLALEKTIEKKVKEIQVRNNQRTGKPPCWRKEDFMTQTHKIPVAANTWVRNAEGRFNERARVTRTGLVNWTNKNEIIRTYFRTDLLTKEVQITLVGKFDGRVAYRVSFGGRTRIMKLKGTNELNLQKWKISKPGYQKLVLQGIQKGGATFGELVSIKVTGIGKINYNPFSTNNWVYHWARRGPTLTLWHKSAAKQIDYFYSELRVPKGLDTVGSYFVANGFNVGYFGMQVNSETERRVLFSVWSPFKTDNPSEIPADYRVNLIRKGEEVMFQDFGNEGSGGQSRMKYQWKPETTYGFLLKGVPAEDNHSEYTAWFKAPGEDWKLIATWSRPKQAQYLKGLYSFAENFREDMGDRTRMCYYGRQWMHDTNGKWYESTQAIAGFRNENRFDVESKVKGNSYYIKHIGFFNSQQKPKETLNRASDKVPPTINFANLP